DRGVVGRPLIAELGGEARHGVAVPGVVVVLLGGPGHPVVHGAVVGVARILGQGPGVGAGGGVAAGGVEIGPVGRVQLGVVGEPPAGAFGVVLLPAPVVVALDVLVAAVPVDQRGMPGQAHVLLAGLGLELAAQRVPLGVGGAGHGEVLPHHDPQFIAQVVEELGFVEPAAPDAQGVHAGLDRIGDACAVVL